MILIDSKTRQPLAIGQQVLTFRNETATLVDVVLPRHSSSTGRVVLRMKHRVGDAWDHAYYPSVINAEWIEGSGDGAWEVAE